jgi:hypothetical protein
MCGNLGHVDTAAGDVAGRAVLGSLPRGPAGDWHGGDVHLYDVPDTAIEKRFRFAYD